MVCDILRNVSPVVSVLPLFLPDVLRGHVARSVSAGSVAILTSLSGVGTAAVLAPAPAAAQPSPAAEADTSCDPQDSTANRVVDARMGWGVRESFRSYITSSIANGGWTSGDGAVFSDGEFVFSGDDGVVSVVDGAVTDVTLVFAGSVNFTGHGGVLDMTVANPEIRMSGDDGMLIADVTSHDTDGEPHNYGRINVASLSPADGDSQDSVTDGIVDGDAGATLTPEGSTAMGEFYEAGAEMDPLTFQAALADGCEGDGPELEAMPDDDGDGTSDNDPNGGDVTIRDADGGSDGSDSSQDDENPVVAFLTTPSTAIPTAVVALVVVLGGWFGVRRRRSGDHG
ncbi:Putative membrane associated protein [Corynebacterium glyciniphilum AJ 3170]|uniref:Putative membrane associated protein n=1 Tax=Corynebacterium glyciniphilum AJ 3170 TaxID=1404245 RepID=X5ECX3_9CORY|nr:Putative membrane associated protein [Corynebacterium glyciniphilum AJ 3170]